MMGQGKQNGRQGIRILLVVLALWLVVVIARSLVPVDQGLRADYFAGSEWSGTPVLTTLDPTISTGQMRLRWRYAAPEAFSVQWSGYVLLDRPGIYAFAVAADDRARLYVNRRLVVDTEARHSPLGESGRIQLDRGANEIVLQFAQVDGPYSLGWSWAPDGESLTGVPAWRLSTRPRGKSALLTVRYLGWLGWALGVGCATLAARVAFRRRGLAGRHARPDNAPAAEPIDDSTDRWLQYRLPCLALFIALAVLQTWPLASNPGGLSRNDTADTMLNEWTIAWVAHQLPRDPLHLFDANIFYPDRRTLAYSESLIVQSVMAAPLLWLGASPVLAYNLVLLAGMALTGWTMCLVTTRWTGDRVAGIAAGTLLAFNAHTLTRLPHLQAQHGEFLPLALLALDALLRTRRLASAVWLAIWFTLQALTSVYLLVLSLIALAVAVLARPEDWLGARFRLVVPKLAIAGTVATALLLPFLWPYARVHIEQGITRQLEEVARFSATASDYLMTPSRVHNWMRPVPTEGTGLFPGFAGLLLAGIALLSGRAFTDGRVRMCLAFGVCGVLLSFGPAVPGYVEVYAAVPLMQAVRAAARFGYLATVGIAVLAGFGVMTLRRRLHGRSKLAMSAAIVAIVTLEPLAAPIRYQPFRGIPSIYRSLRDKQDVVVAELPFPSPRSVFRNAPYILNSTAHWQRLLNGYGGFIPASYYRHAAALADFPSEEAVAALRDFGVTHAFVHLDRLDASVIDALERLPGMRRVAEEGRIVLYEVSRK